MSEVGGYSLLTFRVTVCLMCLGGVGSECHTPGCAFWMADVPADDVASRLMFAFTNDDDAVRDEAGQGAE